MRTIIFVTAACFSMAAFAQATRDANPRAKENTQGANNPAIVNDPATKARVTLEGVAGGTGSKVPSDANGGATVSNGRQNRHPQYEEQPGPDSPKPPFAPEKKE
jgi:hypothetical protein